MSADTDGKATTSAPPKAKEPPSPVLGTRFIEALAMAVQLHAEHSRKGSKIPYVSHLLGVASIALEHGADEEQAIAALLHDAIEDQPRGGETKQDILKAFGSRVLGIVEGCSDSDGQNKPSWKERKEAYVAHLRKAPAEMALVSGADKLHNARAILSDFRTHGPAVFDRFTAKKDGTLRYYKDLVGAFREAGNLPEGLLRELSTTVSALESEAR